MAEFDFSKFKGIDISKLVPQQPMIDIDTGLLDSIRQTEAVSRSIQKAREEREAEELRRHDEVVSAIKNAADKGANIVIGDNASSIQILQNSPGATQKIDNSRGLDLQQVRAVLEEIKEYFDFPQFSEAFGDNTENVKSVIEQTIQATADSQNEGIVRKSLHVLRDLAMGASGSLIASGILALLGALPM